MGVHPICSKVNTTYGSDHILRLCLVISLSQAAIGDEMKNTYNVIPFEEITPTSDLMIIEFDFVIL
jgi:hypothetical protein